jgi:capsular polysaccharide biosynthesis protein
MRKGVITKELKEYNTFLYSLILLFFKSENILIIENYQLVSINELYMVHDYSVKKKENVLFLQDKLTQLKERKFYSKIITIKTNFTQNCSKGVFEDEYVKYFESFGFVFIKCEDYNIIELFNIFNSAEYIIMSWGYNSYLNSMLINNDITNVLVIANIKYKNEYDQFVNNEINTDWFPNKCKNKFFIGDLTNEFTNQIKTLLDDKINDIFVL